MFQEFRCFLAILPLLLIGCSEYTIGKAAEERGDVPVILATPNPVYFGFVAVGDNSTKTFTLSNEGAAMLRVKGITMEGSTSFVLTDPSIAGDLNEERTLDVIVEYTANEEGESATALVSSNDPLHPTYEVELIAGTDYPELEAVPSAYDFGTVVVGSSDSTSITLNSIGNVPCTIESIDIADAQFTGTPELPLPVTVDPGESLVVHVDFVPTHGDSISTEMVVRSDAYTNPTRVTLTANGYDSKPVAVCSASPTEVALHTSETATFYGEESYDNAGYRIVDYDWTLSSKPAGSTATMPAGGSNRRGFSPDLVGDYVGKLVVTNEVGVASDPCYATVTGIPLEDLWIEMYWAHSGDDMDLHLVRPGGTVADWFNDCYYINCVPPSSLDWGTRGDATDNPALDLDDIPGTGPENINVDDPESGTFTVYVHDYPGSVYSGANDVTVTVYIAGIAMWTDTRALTTEDRYYPFCDIQWPAGTVTSR
jgi:hypothetical protein